MVSETFTACVISCWSMGGRGTRFSCLASDWSFSSVLEEMCRGKEREGGEEGGRDISEPVEVQERDRELSDSCKRDEG